MTATQTAGTGGVRGEVVAARPGPHEAAFLAEMNRQHRAGIPNLDNVTDPDVLGAYGLEPDWVTCEECGDRFNAGGEDRKVCDDCDVTEPDDEPHYYVCPTCGGNGCGPCQGTGERLDTTHQIGQDR